MTTSNPVKPMQTLYTAGTFARAYDLQKQMEAKARKNSLLERQRSINSVEKLDEMLHKVFISLDNGTLKVADMKAMLMKIADPFKRHLVSRHDKNKLDIIHHCILINNYEILDLLLADTSFCHPKHKPLAFPYAHLAATVGHSKCLKIILTKRPDDFFKCTLPRHAVKIEAFLERKFKLRRPAVKPKMLIKKTEALLAKFKVCSEEDEKGILSAAKLSVLSTNVKATLKDLRNGIIDHDEHRHEKLEQGEDRHETLEQNEHRNEKFEHGEYRHEKLDNISFLSSVITEPEQQGYLYRLRKKDNRLPKGSHRMNIYQDLFSKEPPGVLGGAGVAARVQLHLPSLTQSPVQPQLLTKTGLDSTKIGIPVIPEIDIKKGNCTNNYLKTERTHNANNRSQQSLSKTHLAMDSITSESIMASCQKSPRKLSNRNNRTLDKGGKDKMDIHNKLHHRVRKTISTDGLPLNSPASKYISSLTSMKTEPEQQGYLGLYRLRKKDNRLPKGSHRINIHQDNIPKETPGVLGGAGVAAREQLHLPSLTPSPVQPQLLTKTGLDSTKPGIPVLPEIYIKKRNCTSNYMKRERMYDSKNSSQQSLSKTYSTRDQGTYESSFFSSSPKSPKQLLNINYRNLDKGWNDNTGIHRHEQLEHVEHRHQILDHCEHPPEKIKSVEHRQEKIGSDEHRDDELHHGVKKTSSTDSLPQNTPASTNISSLTSMKTESKQQGYLDLYRLRKKANRLTKGVLGGTGVVAREKLHIPSLTQSPVQGQLLTKTGLDSTKIGIPVLPEIDIKRGNCTNNYMKTERMPNSNNSSQQSPSKSHSTRDPVTSVFDKMTNSKKSPRKPLYRNYRTVSNEGKGSMEIGIRKVKNFKKFEVKLTRVQELQNEESSYMNKTPLTMAAERGYTDCIQATFNTIIMRANPLSNSDHLLTMATLARSPETIVYLIDAEFSHTDYESALLTAIRRLFPDCLAALLSANKECKLRSRNLFEGNNLYHMLYNQGLNVNFRYELMPEMTKVLIAGGISVNEVAARRTFPMYSLISCAYSDYTTDKIYFYTKCLELLLMKNANPHYDEHLLEKKKIGLGRSVSGVQRAAFSSVIACILDNTEKSIEQFKNKDRSILLMKIFLTIITKHCKSTGYAYTFVMFKYIDRAHKLGLDKTTLNILLRCGADPDAKKDGMYAINVYFDRLFSYLKQVQVDDSYEMYVSEIDILRSLFARMSKKCLHEALIYFLDKQLPFTPVQGVGLSRYFSWVAHDVLRTPLSLTSRSALFVWNLVKRDVKYAEKLPISSNLIKVIIPRTY